MEPQPQPASRSRAFFKKLKQPSSFSKPQLAIFIVAFGIIGYFVYHSFAAAQVVATLEGEQMTYKGATVAKTFGRTSIGSKWTGGLIANDRFIQKTSLSDYAQVTKLNYYLRGDGTNSQVAKAIIYADSNGSPSVLMGQGTEVLVNGGQADGWVAFPFANPVSLNPGNYWIGLIRGTTGGTIDVATDKTGGSEAYAPNTYTNGALNPFGQVKGTTTFNLSGYASYTVSGSRVVNDSSASGGKEIELMSNGTISGNFSLPSAATSLSVLAKANLCSGVGAAMSVKVDGNQLLATTVNATSLTSYSSATNLTAGTHMLTISYSNDMATSTCNRNLYVDVTNFYGPVVVTPAPTVALSASPTSVTAGQSATLTWNSTNATSCTASGAWSGSEPTSGSISTGALNQNSTYGLTCAGSGGSATASTTVTVSAVTTSGGTPGIGVYELGGNLAYLSTPNIYSIVIGDAWDNISTIQNVAGRGLAYFSTVSNPRYSTGIPYTQASSNGWILKCGTADCINPQFGTYGIDLGSTAVQQAWISNVESYLSGHPGIDGVFIDTVIYDPYATFKAYPNKYPDTASWAQAMLSFMKAVHTGLNAKGYYVAANTGAYRPGSSTYNDGSDTISWFKMVGPYTDSMMNEFYDEASGGNYLDKARSTGTAWYQNWDGWQRLIGVAQSMGKDFIGAMYGGCTDTTQMTYGKASFLLEWNGGGSIFAYNGGKACDSTNSAWTKDIGKPSAAKVQVGVGWMRSYTKGMVLVNPSPTNSQTFTVNGTSYTLGPTTARIL